MAAELEMAEEDEIDAFSKGDTRPRVEEDVVAVAAFVCSSA